MPREHIRLECTTCKNRNYDTTKNRSKHKERLAVKKFCAFCRQHTDHREAR
ncbi:MAG: 50S ribosomal protein L33 [Acidobacteriaceae bacterium]